MGLFTCSFTFMPLAEPTQIWPFLSFAVAAGALVVTESISWLTIWVTVEPRSKYSRTGSFMAPEICEQEFRTSGKSIPRKEKNAAGLKKRPNFINSRFTLAPPYYFFIL